MTLIAIDPGHGKETAGKRSPDGSLLEYEFNRDVARRIEKHLNRHGVKTIITCPTDSVLLTNNDKDLRKRCQIANDAKADYFMSIHANAHGNGSEWTTGHGWEIFSYKLKGEGYELAKEIQSESIPYLGIKNRGIKDGSSFRVLKSTKMPAVLIEHAFYTNKEECALLKSSDFREKCAIADAKGMLKHLGIAWKDEVTDTVKEYKISINGKVTSLKAVNINGVVYVPFTDVASLKSFSHTIKNDVLDLKIK